MIIFTPNKLVPPLGSTQTETIKHEMNLKQASRIIV